MIDKGYLPNTLYGWIDELLKIKAKYGHDVEVNFQVICDRQGNPTVPAVHHHTFSSKETGVSIIIEEIE